MKTEPKKTIYYEDELQDDFAGRQLPPAPVTAAYPYRHRNPLWHLSSFFLYRAVATPVALAFCKCRFGVRLHNRRALRRVRGGCFLYANHTQNTADAFLPTLISFPRKANIVVGPQAVSRGLLRTLVPMLGGLPLPGEVHAAGAFREELLRRTGHGQAVTVYPEAHIWPYYTGVRPFPADSFAWPVKLDRPVIAYAVTYRRRRILRRLPPLIDVWISDPIRPDQTLDARQARQALREQTYRFLLDRVSHEDNFAYYRYVRREGEKTPTTASRSGQ